MKNNIISKYFQFFKKNNLVNYRQIIKKKQKYLNEIFKSNQLDQIGTLEMKLDMLNYYLYFTQTNTLSNELYYLPINYPFFSSYVNQNPRFNKYTNPKLTRLDYQQETQGIGCEAWQY